jgi:DNA-binding transcriptional MerR regulator
MKTSYSIGEFSQIKGLSARTLRFYHEKGILVPTSIDATTGYRFYDASIIEKARVIMRLRQMDFSIEDIGAVFTECADDANILNHLERQKQLLQQRISQDQDIVRSLSEVIVSEKEAKRISERTVVSKNHMGNLNL